MQAVNKIIAESQIEQMQAAMSAIKALEQPSAEFRIIEAELARLNEELTGGDWGRIGVLAGLLWYKLDTMIKLLGDNNQELKNIGNHLRK